MIRALITSGRLRAFAIHLGLSLLAIGVLAASMLLIWYPQPYFRHDGGWHVLRLLVAVDVVLGPLLTLIVFNRAKRELRRDLTLIGVVQIAALVYGVTVAYTHRPAFVVAYDQDFYAVSWPDVQRATRDPAAAAALLASGTRPVFVSAELPPGLEERQRLRSAAQANGVLLPHLGQYYLPMTAERLQRYLARSAPIAQMAQGDAEIARELARVLQRHQLPVEQLSFMLLHCRYSMIMLVYERRTGKLIDWME